jgi:hypothetical protein
LVPEAQKDSVHIHIRNKTKIKDPGKWLLGTDEFKNWQNSKSSSGLWLRGSLGTGKTVLTSTVIGRISRLYQGTAQVAFAYYYCSGSSKKINAGGILGNILRQLAETESGQDALQAWEEAGHRPRDLTNETLEGLIHELVNLNVEFQTTTIIDAPDEVEQEEFFTVIDVLENLLDEASGLVKVFVSSKPEDHNNILDTWSKIEIDPHLTRKDIEMYIETQIDKKLPTKKKVDNELHDEVKIYLKDSDRGMFVVPPFLGFGSFF